MSVMAAERWAEDAGLRMYLVYIYIYIYIYIHIYTRTQIEGVDGYVRIMERDKLLAEHCFMYIYTSVCVYGYM